MKYLTIVRTSVRYVQIYIPVYVTDVNRMISVLVDCDFIHNHSELQCTVLKNNA